jgi:predicted regulator of Ras-like GTPase activity (Roadblock/LC7/MglB family)
MTKSPNFEAILNDLFEMYPVINGAAFISATGFPIASKFRYDLDDIKTAPMIASLVAISKLAANEMAKGTFEQLYLKGKNGYILAKDAGKRTVLMISTTSELQLDSMRDFKEGGLPFPFDFKPTGGDVGGAGIIAKIHGIVASYEEKFPYCKYCGNPLSKGQSICDNCGKRI